MTSSEPRGAGVGTGGERGFDAQLARHLLEVAELMIRSSDVDTVLSQVVDECTLLVGVDAVGLLLADGDSGGVRAVACSLASAMPAGALQQRTTRGPTVDVLRTGEPLEVVLEAPGRSTRTEAESADPWPVWTAVMSRAGIRRVTCLPVCLVDEPVGGLELYSTHAEPLPPTAWQVAGVFAGLAAVVVHHAEELRHTTTRARQLEHALEVRTVVEQAKGFLCAQGFDGPDAAFGALRQFSRRTRQRLETVSAAVVSGELSPSMLRDTTTGAGRADDK